MPLVELTQQTAGNLPRASLGNIGDRDHILRLSDRANMLAHMLGECSLQLVFGKCPTFVGERHIGDCLVAG